MSLQATHTPIQNPSSASSLMDGLESLTAAEQAELAPQETPQPTEAAEENAATKEAQNEAAPEADAAPTEEAQAADSTEETEESAAEEKADAESSDEDATEVATIKSVDGTEVPENITFSKKVDGKDVNVSLKDLLDDFSGKTAVKTRFAEANQIKQRAENLEKKVAKELSAAKSVIERFQVAVKGGQTRDAIDALCELTGADPEQAWADHQKAAKEQVEKYFSMDEAERIRYDAKQEAEYWQRRAKAQKTSKDEALGVHQDAQTRLNNAAKEAGLSQTDLTMAHGLLLDSVEKGLISKEDITVESVVQEAKNIKVYGQIDAYCRSHLPEKAGDQNFYMEVLKDSAQYGLTQADWGRLIKEIKSSQKPAPKPVTSSLNAKLQKTKPFAKKPQVTKAKPEDDYDPISFDEI